MRYPQRTSIVGVVLGVFGFLQILIALLLFLEYFEIFSFTELLYEMESELLYSILIPLTSASLGYYYDEYIIAIGITLIVSGSMYIAFYVLLNKVKQNNAMLKEMYRRMNKY